MPLAGTRVGWGFDAHPLDGEPPSDRWVVSRSRDSDRRQRHLRWRRPGPRRDRRRAWGMRPLRHRRALPFGDPATGRRRLHGPPRSGGGHGDRRRVGRSSTSTSPSSSRRSAIAPHRDEIRANLARALGIVPDLVSVKATTTDGLGLHRQRVKGWPPSLWSRSVALS